LTDDALEILKRVRLHPCIHRRERPKVSKRLRYALDDDVDDMEMRIDHRGRVARERDPAFQERPPRHREKNRPRRHQKNPDY
jgi:hypothetical protein